MPTSHSSRWLSLFAAALLIAACGGSGEDDAAALTRACGDARNACVQACSSGGTYVPEPCRAACATGRETCISRGECTAFGPGCRDGCSNARCNEACDAGQNACSAG